MRVTRAAIFIFLTSLVGSAFSQHPVYSLQSMHLVSPDVGWVLSDGKLFITHDDAKTWKEITPRSTPYIGISSVFFVDENTGWALLSGVENETDEDAFFEVAATRDGGVSWSVREVRPANHKRDVLTTKGRLFFANTRHGWLNVSANGSSNFRPGRSFETQDGGKTWMPIKREFCMAGDFIFANDKDGWFAGGPGNMFLFATHNGGDTWDEMRMGSAPNSELGIHTWLPIFSDANNGFLAFTYPDGDGPGVTLATLTTNDGGHTWKPDREFPLDRERLLSIEVVGSDLIVAADYVDEVFLTSIARNGRTDVKSVTIAAQSGEAALQVSFADKEHGWLLTAHQLLSTRDGGRTWTDIRPVAASLR